MLNLGIIGLGGITRAFHIPSIRKGQDFCIRAAADVFEDTGLAQSLDIPFYYTDYRKMLEDPKIDAVMISTPHDLHAEHCVAALEAGKHVLIEKPIARSLKESQQILDAAQKTDKVLMVGFCERFEPRHQYIRKLIDEGVLGKLLSARTDHYQNFNPAPASWWRNAEKVGGGSVISSGIHRLDLLRWYLGEPTEVFARGVGMEERLEAEACVHAVISFDSGAVANFSINWAIFDYKHYEAMSLTGKDGTLYSDGQTFQLSVKNVENGKMKIVDVPEGYEKMFEHFAKCIREGREPLTNGREGHETLRLVRAIYKSMETGMPVNPMDMED